MHVNLSELDVELAEEFVWRKTAMPAMPNSKRKARTLAGTGTNLPDFRGRVLPRASKTGRMNSIRLSWRDRGSPDLGMLTVVASGELRRRGRLRTKGFLTIERGADQPPLILACSEWGQWKHKEMHELGVEVRTIASEGSKEVRGIVVTYCLGSPKTKSPQGQVRFPHRQQRRLLEKPGFC